MRTAIFSLAYHPLVGGAELAVKEITDRLPNRFFCFTSRFDCRWPGREKIGNVEVVRVGRGIRCQESRIKNYYGHFWRKISYIWQAWREAENTHKIVKFDAIWGVMAAYAGIAALLFKLRHPKIPFLLTLQEGDSESHILRRVGIFYPLWRLVFKKADHIQVISSFLADFARRHGARCPVEVVPNGVNVKTYQVSSIKYQDKETPIIITTSRLVYKNGIDTLIDAMDYVKNPVELRIIGDGPQREILELKAKNSKGKAVIKFLGEVEPSAIPSYLAEANVFVRPSRSEGLGNSFLEAMAAGLPIIGTPVGGIVDFLKDGETGLFTKVDDPKDLAEKIDFLLANEKICSAISANGRKLVLENYSWDKVSEKMDKIFQTPYPIPHTPNPLKILIATGLYPPEIGGPATYTVLLEEELPKFDISVAVLPFRAVRQWPPLIRHLLYFSICFFKALRADLIYAQDTVSVGLPTMLAAKILRKAFFIRVAGDYAWEQAVQRFGVKDSIDEFQDRKYDFKTELLRKVQKFVVNQAKIVITPSKYFQNLVAKWVKNTEKVKVIYNGIKLKNYTDKNPEKSSTRRIFSSGRLVPWKGFDVLIELMKDPRLNDWNLWIDGDGPDNDRLREIIKKENLESRVFMAGAQKREILLNTMSVSDIFILNTSFESFSFRVIEVMNAGIPVITTKIGSLPELIENNKEGILIEPNDREAILSAIKKISENREFREMIVKNAKAKAQNFSIEKTISQLSQVIKNVHNI